MSKLSFEERMKLRENDPSREQVDVIVRYPYTEKTIKVDTLIAQSIQACNNAGLYTRYSCSGHEERNYSEGYVMFCLDHLRVDSRTLLDILESIPEFKIEKRFKWRTRDQKFSGCMIYPTDDQVMAIREYIDKYWRNTRVDIYVREVIARVNVKGRTESFKDENLVTMRTAFAKLEEAANKLKRSV